MSVGVVQSVLVCAPPSTRCPRLTPRSHRVRSPHDESQTATSRRRTVLTTGAWRSSRSRRVRTRVRRCSRHSGPCGNWATRCSAARKTRRSGRSACTAACCWPAPRTCSTPPRHRSPPTCARASTRHLNVERARQREEHVLAQQMSALGLVGRGPRIMNVFRSIVRVSPLSDLPVLISGETGTGKELVARSIHRLDPAAAGAVHSGQLQRDQRRARREPAVRSSPRRVHRRRSVSDRVDPRRPRRRAVPR